MLLLFYVLRLTGYDFFAKIILILGSMFFYGFWNLVYLPILLGSIAINFAIAKAILARNPICAICGGGGQHIAISLPFVSTNIPK